MNPDRYDRAVLGQLAKVDGPVRTKALTELYQQAGVRNRRKAKQRIKQLESSGRIERVGDWLWEYTGTQQELVA